MVDVLGFRVELHTIQGNFSLNMVDVVGFGFKLIQVQDLQWDA